MYNWRLVFICGSSIFVGAAITASPAPNPTFSKDVAPILYKRCVSCHSDSRIAPFSLVGYENARRYAKTIVSVTQSNFMPPWKAKAGYGEFKDPQALTQSEKQILRKWAETGAQMGEIDQIPEPPKVVPGWRLGQPSLIVQQELPTEIPEEGRDFFRDYLVDPKITKPTWVRAIDFMPKHQGTVHHIIPSLVSKEEVEKLRKIKFDFDDHSWKPETVGMIEKYNMLGFWSTGQPPIETPKDVAFLINPGDCFLLDIHYKPKGKIEMEQPQVGLYFQEEAPKDELSVEIYGTGDIYIQPGETNARFYAIGPPSDHDVTIHAVWPHMHYLGKTFKAWVKLPGSYAKPLIAIDEWDPDWQLLYYLKEPMFVPKGSQVYVTGTFDNSRQNPRNPNSPPKVVESGESSKDEMLLFEVFQVEHKPKAKEKKPGGQ
ncbi:MAG TPA: hypothetical protein VK171_03590 [Fimbriimonas sp.]|nr:hypothetical protein [Fimbriimonas sp.]